MKNVAMMLTGMLIMFAVLLAVANLFDKQAIVYLNQAIPLICCGFGTSVATVCGINLLKMLRKEKTEEKALQKERA